jgi:transcriptional regulator with XRE-family HTH domain
MVEQAVAEEATSYQPKRPGERLRAAREAQGLTLADIATRTRIPTRHLEAIEIGNYTSLPSITYATGFTKAYARAVGIDEVDVARDARVEIDQSWDREPTRPSYDPADPARVPSRGLAIGGLLVALLVMIGASIWFGTDWFRGPSMPAATEAPVANNSGLAVPPPGGSVREVAAPIGGGQVTLTATDAVWVRVYDAKDTTLYMREMAKGDRFDVPPTAENPMINIGRPDKLAITVNGSQVPALGDGRRAIKDVPIGATALLARGAGAGATPTPRPTTPPNPAP